MDSAAARYGAPEASRTSSVDDEINEPQVSWLDVRTNCPVIASDGTTVGHVVEVAALAEEDIFHGIVFQHHERGAPVLGPALDVRRITESAVYLSVDSAAAAKYDTFQELHVSRLGLRGVHNWRLLGWHGPGFHIPGSRGAPY
jgi:hypothetical protein